QKPRNPGQDSFGRGSIAKRWQRLRHSDISWHSNVPAISLCALTRQRMMLLCPETVQLLELLASHGQDATGHPLRRSFHDNGIATLTRCHIMKGCTYAHPMSCRRKISHLTWHLRLGIVARPAQQSLILSAFDDGELKIRAEGRDVHPGKSFPELWVKLLTG